jgi:hypothetical protein
MRGRIIRLAFMLAACGLVGWVFGAVEGRNTRWEHDPATRTMQTLRDLYLAGQVDAALAACDMATHDPANAHVLPDIEFIRWITLRRAGEADMARETADSILQRFPHDIVSAHVRKARMLSAVVVGDYAAADLEVRCVLATFPDTDVARAMAAVRKRWPTTHAADSASGDPGGQHFR